MGRKPKLTPHQMKEALRRREAGEPMRDVAKDLRLAQQRPVIRVGVRR